MHTFESACLKDTFTLWTQTVLQYDVSLLPFFGLRQLEMFEAKYFHVGHNTFELQRTYYFSDIREASLAIVYSPLIEIF